MINGIDGLDNAVIHVNGHELINTGQTGIGLSDKPLSLYRCTKCANNTFLSIFKEESCGH